MKIIQHTVKKIVASILPRMCLLCHSSATTAFDLCQACYADLPFLHYTCPRCSHPFPRFSAEDRCDFCQKNAPLPFDRTFALFGYQQPITKLIMDLKFGQALINAKLLGKLLGHRIQTDWYRKETLPELLIPMPLHPTRLKERGYNQAIEIAKALKFLGIPIDVNLTQRIKPTRPQATLSAAEREKNICDAFSVLKPLKVHHIAVLDDVITTGSTLITFCRLLKNQGVPRIDVWCCARPNKLSYMKDGLSFQQCV